MAPTSLRSRRDGYSTHHTHFIDQFTHKESDRRINKKPAALSATQRAALREQLKEVHFLKPDYADNTKINIAGILRKWKS
jgi:DNA-binding transcriptional regulator YiaG